MSVTNTSLYLTRNTELSNSYGKLFYYTDKILTRERFRRMLFIRTKLVVQELCESRGGRPGLSVLRSLLVSVDVKLY